MQTVIHTKDQDLIAGLQTGDKEAFGNLYDRYAPLLQGLISRMVCEKTAVEEVLQKVFLEVWTKKAEYNPAYESLFTWMIKLTRQVVAATVSHTYIPGPDLSDTTASVGPNGTLRGTPIKDLQQQVLELVYCNNNDLACITARLNITEDMLKSMLKSALDNFKTARHNE